MPGMREVQKKVRELLEQTNVRKPPVPVDRIATAQGILIQKSPAKDEISGALIRKGKKSFLGVNTYHHPNRQRFTIAHELGHFIYHDGMRLHVDEDFRINWRDADSSKAIYWDEVEANRFAAELLMPIDFITRDLRKTGVVDDSVIEHFANRYKVSTQAMRIRLASLGYLSPV